MLGAGRGGQTAGRPPTCDSGINIQQKISQWEGRSQPDGGQGGKIKDQKSAVSRTLSADIVENGVGCEFRSCEPQGKASLAKAVSLGLDFRDTRTGGLSRRSDGLEHRTLLEKMAGPDPHPKQNSTPNPPVNYSRSTAAKSCKGRRELLDKVTKDAKLSSSVPMDDPAAVLPPGNFYTCRGFWRKLETHDVLRDQGFTTQLRIPTFEGRAPSPNSTPPPKPRRTFQYQGVNSPRGHWGQWESWSPPANEPHPQSRSSGPPPSCPPPPCPVAHSNGLSRNKKNRKSFEFEDVVRLTGQQGTPVNKGCRSGIYHSLSEDNIYEDIILEGARENPYEDVKLFLTCLPSAQSLHRHTQRSLHAPKLPPKPLALQTPLEKVRKRRNDRMDARASLTPSTPVSRPAPPKHRTMCPKTRALPQYVHKIQEVFNAKRGRKRVKCQGSSGYESSAREETSGTESDPEDGSTGTPLRCIHVQSTLRRRPGYRTLERDLIHLQRQQLFQLFVVVSLRKTSPGNEYTPEITQQFPNKFEKSSRHSREAEDRLKAIPLFCFPDSQDWRPCGDLPSETFSFVLTGEDGSRLFGYCRKILPSGKGKRLPEVHCIVSRLGCFNLFAKVLEEVERRREVSPALVHPFMRSLMEAPFPAPGRTITVKSFLPGSGNEVLTLCRPVDSRLEHVDFQSLLQCLSVERLLQVFASLLLERRVIFIADKLSTLSRCAHAALALLYPFTWQHTFVPVLPASMLDICCSPTPFLMGALLPSLHQLLELPIEEVLVVDLCGDTFVRQLGDEDCILPRKLQAALHDILEQRAHILGREEGVGGEGEEPGLSSLMSEAFVRFFVELVGHYSLHMGDGGGEALELRRDAFRKSHPSRRARQFLQLFMETQMFAGFIQDRELRKGGVKGLFEVRAAEYLESYPPLEPSGVNKFFKGLGNRMKFLQNK
ncbi:DENN domain-containing protein 2C [Arapaima gigas]